MEEQQAPPTDEALKEILIRLGPEVTFGEPVKKGDSIIIPVAEARLMFAYGGGQGTKDPSREEEDQEGEGFGGTGRGFGGGAKVSPRGYITITDEDVTYSAIVNRTPVLLAAMAFGAWFVFMLSRMCRTCCEHMGDRED